MSIEDPKDRSCLWLIAIAILAATSGFAAAPVGAEAAPESWIQQALRTPISPFAGKLSFSIEGGRTRKMRVWVSPDGRFRRELLGARGEAVALIVGDGSADWYYDRRCRAAWRGPASADASAQLVGETAQLVKAHRFRLVGESKMAGRTCRVVEILSGDDHPLRRLWLDEQTGTLLGLTVFGPDGARVSSLRYSNVEFPRALDAGLFQFQPPQGTTLIPSRDRPNFLDPARVDSGRVRPILPNWIPQGFVLRGVDSVEIQGVQVLHSRYSDGLEALSLFQLPGKADIQDDVSEIPPGARIVRMRRGSRKFVLVGRIPETTLKRMADSIP